MTMQGQTWFVTGASAGIGRALVGELAARGANVVAAARNPDDVAYLVAAAPDRVMAVPLDVTQPAQVEASTTAALGRFGAVDVLVNNAGYGLMATIEEASESELRRQFETNLFGPIALIRALLPAMRARRQGFVVNVSSTAGASGHGGSGYYSASKAALEAITEALAGEAADAGIRAMIVSPGPFRTEFFGRSIATGDARFDDYAGTAKTRAAYLGWDGKQSGDPVRAAAIIIDTVTGEAPPMRLPLGAAAVATISDVLRTKLTDLARSEAIAPLADFPEGE